jgi:hypothetical protein
MNRTIRGVDYSFDRANLAQLKAQGYKFVIRYLTGSGKALTVAELKDLKAHGLAVGVVYETTAGRAGAGHAAGQHDAQIARAAAANDGLAGIPIYMAVDDDLSFAAVRPYFEGASGVLGKGKRGAYASGLVLRQLMHAGLIDFAWEAGARGWGDGRRFEGAHILQDPAGHVASASADVNHAAPEAFASFRGGTIKPPKPRRYASRELRQGDTGADVRQFQAYLQKRGVSFLTLDGVYGPQTETAKHDVMFRLGWPDSTIKARDRSHSIGRPGLRAIKDPKTRPQSYKDRERKRAGR